MNQVLMYYDCEVIDFLSSSGFTILKNGVIKPSKQKHDEKSSSYYPNLNAINLYALCREISKWLNPHDFFVFCIDNYTPIIEDEVEIINSILGEKSNFKKTNGAIVRKDPKIENHIISSLSLTVYFSLIFYWNSYLFSDKTTKRRIELKDGVIIFYENEKSNESSAAIIKKFQPYDNQM